MSVTEKIADFIVKTDLAKMPGQVIGITKKAMLDTIGVALAGSVDPAGKTITAFVEKLGSKPVAGVIGGKVRTSSLLAALANGTISHTLDYDDAGAYTQGHPSVVLIPVLLALAEELGASGKEIIEAYVLGVEAWSKVSRAMPMLHLRGWHPTAVLGTIGAAAAAAKLLKLNVKQTTNALGLACSGAAGLGQNFGTMTKPFHAGNAARSGIMAALLAKEGFTAAKDIMEGDMGFPAAFYGESPANISKMAENLGDPFALVSRGINVKRYPSCAGTHRPIDALLHLIDSYDIKPEEVVAVDCRVSPRAKKILLYDNPNTGFEGKFSIQFVMAAAIQDRKIELAQFTDEYVNSPATKGLMRKVSLRIHPDWAEGKDTDARPDIVAIRLVDGREYYYGVALAKGHEKVPLTDEEFLAKYCECAKLVLGDKEIERCLELINKLEELKDISGLMDILVFPR